MTFSLIESFLRIETSDVSLLLFLRGIIFCAGLTLAKLEYTLVKTETSKFSSGVISSGGFYVFLIEEWY